jgi:photosystem II stability/assembly factor-like uncharacterized protein
MKKQNLFVVLRRIALVLLFVSLHAPLSTQAQGTAFTYQGRLNDNGSAANGTYDLRFTIYDALSVGSVAGGPLTNATTVVSNGLFTVTLDFGPGIFTGPDRWLEISAQKNGGGFTTLSPRQPLMPMPYAIFANTASNLSGTLPTAQLIGSLPVSQLSGTIPTAQLPSSVLTNGASGVNVSGTFSGNGSGLTNVPASWQTVSGTNQTATANQDYLLTNNLQTTLTLPASPKVGDIATVTGVGGNGWQVAAGPGQTIAGEVIPAGVVWTKQTNAPAYAWSSIASSADGSHLVAVDYGGGIYTSTNFAANWTQQTNAPSKTWSSVTASADGSHVVAVIDNGGIYTSPNFGVAWMPQTNAPAYSWSSVGSSADGSHLVVVADGHGVYLSTNFGTNWTDSSALANYWYSVASSTDGSHLVAAGIGIYVSTNFGLNWTGQNTSTGWGYVASSADGSHLVATENNGGIYTSSDFGNHWAQSDAPATYWACVAMSADGSHVVAAGNVGRIYTSADSGTNWTVQNSAPSTNWSAVAMSADGSRVAAAVSSGGIYTSMTTLLPFAGVAGETAQFQYIGNGMWQPLVPPVNDNGSALTNLNASVITSGTIPDARLSTNVALLNGNQTFAGSNVFNGNLGINTSQILEGSFMINNNTYLNAHAIYLRGGDEGVADHNHGLAYAGGGITNFGNGFYQVDGPALWGHGGGVLGTRNGTSDYGALVWSPSGVTINGTFNNNSDRNVKQNFTTVTPAQILDKVAQLPVSEWSYKVDASTRHIGPMAQDFYSIFNVGTDDKHIAPIDEGGVALAAIQGLNQKLSEQEAALKNKESEIQELRQAVAELQKTVRKITNKAQE